MEKDQIIAFLCDKMREISQAPEEKIIEAATPIVGEMGLLTSLQLVELMLAVEDFCEENGQEFNWASDATFSARTSVYRSIDSLADALESKFTK